jgi:hypothetical protein
MKHIKNELDPQLLGLHATNSFVAYNSSSRSVMHANHFSQSLVIQGATEKRIQTGIERELGKYTFSIKMPEDGIILRVIDRYPRRADIDSIPFNPETLVIYETTNSPKEIGCFTIPYHRTLHQHFGFQYIPHPAISRLIPGTFIPKDTVFADSPNKTLEGAYKYGIELNTAFMSHPAVSEDGVLISKDVLPRLSFKVYETRVVEFGNKAFPLNLYGTHKTYKPFPEIGETIRPDGILMMLRNYDTDIAPVRTSIYDVLEPDYIFDKAIYVRGPGGYVEDSTVSVQTGVIVDIKIYHDDNDNSPTPSGMLNSMSKYIRAFRSFYKEILETEKQLRTENKKKYGDYNIKFKPDFHRLAVEARAVLSEEVSYNRQKHKLNKLYRKNPLDDYRIVFTIEYTITPNIGFKLTDISAGKGVICQIEEPENMPVDTAGNRADIIMDSGATISRMNLGRLYEQYIGASARDLATEIRNVLGIAQMHESQATIYIEEILEQNPALFNHAVSRLLGFYQIISPKQFEFYSSLNVQDQIQHLAAVIEQGIYLYMPTNNDPELDDTILQLEQYCPPTYGPVSYVGNSGNKCVTIYPVRIGPVYMLLLDKIGDDYSSCSSARCQYLGIISPITRNEKFTAPYRNSGSRTISETEARLLTGYCGREACAEIMDRNNNPSTHRMVVRSILEAQSSTNIVNCIDRDVVPLGGAKPIQLIKHVEYCMGFKSKYEPPEV